MSRPAGHATQLSLLAVFGLFGVLGPLGLLGPLGHAAASTATAPTGVDTAQRSYTQRSLTKLRSGSYLATNTVLDSRPELRSDLELRRDAELEKHYGRLGQLDAVVESATKAQSVALLETAEITRRNETQRFNAAMQGLRLLQPTHTLTQGKACARLIYRRAIDQMRRQVLSGHRAAIHALEQIDAQLEREKELLQ